MNESNQTVGSANKQLFLGYARTQLEITMDTPLDKYLSSNGRLIVAEDVRHCLELLADIGEFGHPSYYFRGVSDEKYRLLSSLDRMGQVTRHFILGEKHQKGYREQLLIREFRKIAHNHLESASIPKTHFEWLSMMQHYAIPTRLVDLSKSPYVALYFAVRKWITPTSAALWAIAPHALHEVSVRRLKATSFPYPITETNYSQSEMPDFLADTYFDEAFLGGRYDVAMILNPNWANARLACQQGAFLISGSPDRALDDTVADLLGDRSHMDPVEAEMSEKSRIDMSVKKLIIPGKMKKGLLAHLRRMNIHAGTLFPGVEGAALGILEHALMEEWDTHMEKKVMADWDHA